MESNQYSLTWLLTAAAGFLVLIYSRTIIQGISGLAELFQPFLMGVVIAFILSRPYELFAGLYTEKLHFKNKTAHILGILSAYLVIFAVLAAVIWVVIPQLASSIRLFAQNVEYYLENLQRELDVLAQKLHLTGIDLSSVLQLVQAGLGQFDHAVVPKILSVTGTMLHSLATFAIAIAFSVYLLAGKKRILFQLDRILKAYLSQRIYADGRYVLKIIVESFRNYIVGQSTEAVILGGLCFAGMFLLRLDYAGMVSMVVAITALIPILGAYIGGVIAAVLLFMVSPMKALIFLLFFVILQQVENNVIYPRVVGRRIGLPGIWVLLAITVGGKLGGVVGMLFGVPTMTIVYTLLRNSVRAREKRKRV